MFTVKWIADNGAHHLYSGAKDVSYTPPDDERAQATVSFSYDNADHVSIYAGEVYVMNENGRTVSNYTLATKDFPHGLAPRAA